MSPNDFVSLVEVEQRLLGFQCRYQQAAMPFDRRYTRCDLDRLRRRPDDKEQLANAASLPCRRSISSRWRQMA